MPGLFAAMSLEIPWLNSPGSEGNWFPALSVIGCPLFNPSVCNTGSCSSITTFAVNPPWRLHRMVGIQQSAEQQRDHFDRAHPLNTQDQSI